VITRTVIGGDTDEAKRAARASCFRSDTNELHRTSPSTDALSQARALFTKWIIFKHKNFS
jgi:hypothetical protein